MHWYVPGDQCIGKVIIGAETLPYCTLKEYDARTSTVYLNVLPKIVDSAFILDVLSLSREHDRIIVLKLWPLNATDIGNLPLDANRDAASTYLRPGDLIFRAHFQSDNSVVATFNNYRVVQCPAMALLSMA